MNKYVRHSIILESITFIIALVLVLKSSNPKRTDECFLYRKISRSLTHSYIFKKFKDVNIEGMTRIAELP